MGEHVGAKEDWDPEVGRLKNIMPPYPISETACNDGYFGKSAARQQHLEIVRMRAAENRRWILRSTNDGITGTIDPAGRLRGTLPLFVEAASRTGFTFIRERTFYTRYGDWFPILCALIAAGVLLGNWLRSARSV